jgi:hypothetical protein
MQKRERTWESPKPSLIYLFVKAFTKSAITNAVIVSVARAKNIIAIVSIVFSPFVEFNNLAVFGEFAFRCM